MFISRSWVLYRFWPELSLEKPTQATALQGSGTRGSSARIFLYERRQAL